MNKLIELWQITAKTIHTTETQFMQMNKKEEKERVYTYSKLAQRQLIMIEEESQDFHHNLTDEQKEVIDYLKKVMETNKL